MTRRALLLAAALAAAAMAQTRAGLPTGTVRAIEKIMTAGMSRTGTPGVSLAIAVDGRIQYASGFGLADLENDVPATADTVYRLGSISKPITATAAMQLVESGKLDLDDPVRKYVPDFPEKPWVITVRHLLCHQSGIRHYNGVDEVNSTRHYTNLLEPLQIFENDPLLFEPGTRYSYSSYAYNLLGAVVEAASGEKFTDYLRAHIFAPAGMDRTQGDSVADIIAHRAQGYRKLPDGSLRNSDLADTSNKIPAGGLCSTAVDLVKFALALEEGKLVRRETLDRMITPQKLRDGTLTTYGLGWFTSTYHHRSIPRHGGGQQRVSTMLAMDPGSRFAYATMCNLEGSNLAVDVPLYDLLLK